MIWTDKDTEILNTSVAEVSQLKNLKSALQRLSDDTYDSVVRDDGKLIERTELLITATEQLIIILEERKYENALYNVFGPI